jgi:multiple sugar transport system permease protein
VAIALFPVIWMAITAFKQDADLYRMDHVPFWFYLPPTLKHFRLLFAHTDYGRWVLNTLTVATCVAITTLLTAIPAGYALARLRLPGAERTGIAIFLTYLVPPIILFLPLARVVGWLGLYDSRWALALVYPTFTIPFCTWLMMGFFKTIPLEIEEAARVDGCGQVSALVRIVLPNSRAAIFITTVFAFTLSMQELLYAVVFVAPTDQKMVTVGVATMLIRGDIYYWGALMAAALLTGLPVAILYAFVVDYFIQGLTGGALG